MSPLGSLVFGLGLFFLGLQLVGQNLRQLSGGGFRHLVKSATHAPALAGLLGLVAGALMQSATAVTFVLVSMVASGLIQSAPARVVVVWCNVGLTALAFLATVNIHPLVAYLVGAAGIFVGSVRAKPWNTVAGVLLGVGLILFALGEMSAGAAPLKEAAWFRDGIALALHSPVLAFLCGIVAAAVLQSNTGAAMLIITLSGAGVIPVERAIPVIYGANLGAIVLRFFLASGMKGAPLRLVRMEDFFCLFSGAIMMSLFFLEKTGIPLVAALSALAHSPGTQLAIVFLLSNLIPAILLTPVLGSAAGMLKRLWPDDTSTRSLLTSQALADPASALDLIPKELARLLASLRVDAAPTDSTDPENRTPRAFQTGAMAIEQFCGRLASQGSLTTAQALTLQRLRAGLHTVRHIGEATSEFADAFTALPRIARETASGIADALRKCLILAAQATDTLDAQAISAVHDESKHHHPGIDATRAKFQQSLAAFDPETRIALAALLDDFEIAVWLIHRLAKLEGRLIEQIGPPAQSPE